MRKLTVFLFLQLCVLALLGQKKPLDHTVYDGWQHIGERMISNDGKWVVYTIDPQQGDNELVIQTSDAKYKKIIPRGYSAVITEDSRFVICKIKPYFRDTREAKIRKRKPADMPKDSVAIIELGKEDIFKKDRVKGFKTPAKSSGWVAYQLEETIPSSAPSNKVAVVKSDNGVKKVSDSLGHIIDSLEQLIQSIPSKKKKNKDDEGDAADADGDDATGSGGETGSDLLLRNLLTGEEKTYHNVTEYYFSKTGNKLLMETVKNPKDSASAAGVKLLDCATGKWAMLSRNGNDFRNFTMTDDGSQAAYVAERDAQPKDLQKFYRLWYYANGMDSAILLADKFSAGMNLGMTISEFATVNFSKNGKRLFFGVAPIQPPKDTTLVEFEHPKVDIWHYKDDYLQTVQNNPARLKADLQQSFLAVYDLEQKSIRQLGSKELPQVIQTKEGDGDTFVGVTDYGKRVESQWLGNTYKDIYAIDVNTGNKKRVKENLYGQVYPSSTGKYIMWYDRKAKHYFAWDGATTRNITEKIKVPLYQEDWDTPEEPQPYGVMGWHEGDSAVYVYDRYDVWRINLADRTSPVNSTLNGRIKKITYRYIKLDPEELFLTGNAPLYFRVQNLVDMQNGVFLKYSLNETSGPVTVLPLGNYAYKYFARSKDKSSYIFTRENFMLSPGLYSGLNQEIPLALTNKQQENYYWGTAELFHWKAYNGKDATGIVYKPENFDPKKKYPMICYFYEKLSDGLYDYKEPAPIRSAINVPFFVSRGYIIFMPDIEYKTGYPGKSAYDYIVSGARAIVKKGWADSTNLAIQGHSWGGYQAAQLATMTKLFKAVWAGAPVANMTSAYGGIRWESGVNRQFQYEKSQSRIGATLWEKLPLYLENSPLFHLDHVTAPMVMMANDADGAVPWYQGIEMFTALRRLGKKVWMFNYNGQGHGLTQRQDMLDYQIRMQQFFDWILKGDKPAKWITEGVPAVKKGKDWGLEIVD